MKKLKIEKSNFNLLGEQDLSKTVIKHLENSIESRDSLLDVDLKERILKLRK